MLNFRCLVGVAAGLAITTACGTVDPTLEAPAPEDANAQAFALALETPFASLELPPNSRAHAPTPPDAVPLAGWKPGRAGFTTALPIRSRNFYFFRPSPGMRVVYADGREIPHRAYKEIGKPFWSFDAKTLTVHGLSEQPEDGALSLLYPRATEREAALNLDASGRDPEDFVRATVQAGRTSRSGLLLPAPAKASWDFQVPERGELYFSPSLIRPEIADAEPSDGATLSVTLTVDGTTETLWSGALVDDRFTPVKVDLAAWQGKSVTLGMATDPGPTARFDYVFVAEPVVATRKEKPQRIVLVFVDTLRPGHTSAYGYHRDTTPALERIAASGARFDNARSVAPWTLPSTRTMVTGNDPEAFDLSQTVQGRLAKEGWATAMIAANLYLGSNFGLNRDWGTHEVHLLDRANQQLDRALAWLDAHEGRDAFLLIQLMDAHLPYKEPEAYRRKYAGDPPASLPRDEFHRAGVVRARLKTDEDRQYIKDRYDNNIRFTDDQLSRLYERLGPYDAVVFVSDHGEEFWDHGGFEHGHTLHDELLRVPLIVRAPGVPHGVQISEPASLLDVAPTILDIAGVSHEGLKGTSLLPAAKDAPGAREALQERDQAFGRPLYGKERWGVLADEKKYAVVGQREQVFDLVRDAVEYRNMLQRKPELAPQLRERMAEALGREVVIAYRASARSTRGTVADDLTLVFDVPGGARLAWVGDDPTKSSHAVVQMSEDRTQVTATWPKPFRGSRDVWIVPSQPIETVTHELKVTATVGPISMRHDIPADAEPTISKDGPPLLRETTGSRSWDVGFGITPVPLQGGKTLEGADDELTAELKAMGYLTDDEEPEDKDKDKAPH